MAKAKQLNVGDIFTAKPQGEGDSSVQLVVLSTDVKDIEGGDEDVLITFKAADPVQNQSLGVFNMKYLYATKTSLTVVATASETSTHTSAAAAAASPSMTSGESVENNAPFRNKDSTGGGETNLIVGPSANEVTKEATTGAAAPTAEAPSNQPSPVDALVELNTSPVASEAENPKSQEEPGGFPEGTILKVTLEDGREAVATFTSKVGQICAVKVEPSFGPAETWCSTNLNFVAYSVLPPDSDAAAEMAKGRLDNPGVNWKGPALVEEARTKPTPGISVGGEGASLFDLSVWDTASAMKKFILQSPPLYSQQNGSIMISSTSARAFKASTARKYEKSPFDTFTIKLNLAGCPGLGSVEMISLLLIADSDCTRGHLPGSGRGRVGVVVKTVRRLNNNWTVAVLAILVPKEPIYPWVDLVMVYHIDGPKMGSVSLVPKKSFMSHSVELGKMSLGAPSFGSYPDEGSVKEMYDAGRQSLTETFDDDSCFFITPTLGVPAMNKFSTASAIGRKNRPPVAGKSVHRPVAEIPKQPKVTNGTSTSSAAMGSGKKKYRAASASFTGDSESPFDLRSDYGADYGSDGFGDSTYFDARFSRQPEASSTSASQSAEVEVLKAQLQSEQKHNEEIRKMMKDHHKESIDVCEKRVMDHKENTSKWVDMSFGQANKRLCIEKSPEEDASMKLSKAEALIEQASAFKRKAEEHADSPVFAESLQAKAERLEAEAARIINEM